MNRLPDDPEAEIMERLRGGQPGQPVTPPAGEDAVSEPTPEGEEPETPPEAEDEPGIATDDEIQLERQIGPAPAQ